MKTKLTCIICPMSCNLEIDEELIVSGNRCPRGAIYAKQEITLPLRTLTSTVYIENGIYDRLPIITSSPIPKDKIQDIMVEINKVKVKAPINFQDVIIENILGLNVNIIASRSMTNKS